jgi:hypothetical protein
VTTVARLLPRHWDGRRLLQFLTGLALIALAFAIPALLGPSAPPADAPVTVITTVDTPLPPGLPLTDLPAPAAAGNAPAAPSGLALDTAAADQAAAVDQTAAADQAADAGEGRTGAAGADAGLVQGENGLPVLQRPHGRLVCTETRAAAGGATQRSHSERGPPQA